MGVDKVGVAHYATGWAARFNEQPLTHTLIRVTLSYRFLSTVRTAHDQR